MQGTCQLLQGAHLIREVRRHPSGHHHVPVDQTGARRGSVQQRAITALMLGRAHVLENVREIKTVETPPHFLDTPVMYPEAVQPLPDPLSVLRPEVPGQRLGPVSAGQDTREVRVRVCGKGCERSARPVPDARGNGAVHIMEKGRVTSEAPHHGSTEEHPEHEPPAPVVPFATVERFALFPRPWAQQRLHPMTRVDPTQRTSAERVEVRLEFSGVHQAALDELGSVVPKRAREVGEAIA